MHPSLPFSGRRGEDSDIALSLQAVDDEGFGVGTFNASLAVDVKRSALAMDGERLRSPPAAYC
jgi:hypothetical protein